MQERRRRLERGIRELCEKKGYLVSSIEMSMGTGIQQIKVSVLSRTEAKKLHELREELTLLSESRGVATTSWVLKDLGAVASQGSQKTAAAKIVALNGWEENANLLANCLAGILSDSKSGGRAVDQIVESLPEGVVQIKGRLQGSERSQRKVLRAGIATDDRQLTRAGATKQKAWGPGKCVDYGFAEAHTDYGVCSVKVWKAWPKGASSA